MQNQKRHPSGLRWGLCCVLRTGYLTSLNLSLPLCKGQIRVAPTVMNCPSTFLSKTLSTLTHTKGYTRVFCFACFVFNIKGTCGGLLEREDGEGVWEKVFPLSSYLLEN